MYLKGVISILVASLLVFSICACDKEKSVKTISDIAYDNNKTNYIVYVEEDGQYVPFIVLTDNYGGKTLLLRKDVMKTPRRMNDYSSYYEDCEMDEYLNEEYIGLLGEFTECVEEVDLEITDKSAIGTCGKETKTIKRKIFLLSGKEIDMNDDACIGDEGKALSYFVNPENRIAYYDGKTSGWWLRSPDTYWVSCTMVIGPNNSIGSTNSYDLNRYRPAFCVSGDLQIVEKDGIVEGQSVYVFESEN